MQPIIKANNVSHCYGKQNSIYDLSLTLERGEVMALLGTNGAGKTTTLRLLTGDLAPNSGTITINNIDLNLQPCKAKQYLGYLPDIAPLYEDLTVDEFLTYCAKIHGLTSRDARNRVQEVKKFCELQSVNSRLIKKLSKGYKQRIGIAQAIVHRPRAVILDEPTNGLDPTQMQEMRDLILHLRSDAGVLLSTHQLNEVEQICDRVHMIKEGRTVMSKNIDDLQISSSIRIRFAHTPPIDELNTFQGIQKILSHSTTTVEVIADCDLDALKENLLLQARDKQWQDIRNI